MDVEFDKTRASTLSLRTNHHPLRLDCKQQSNSILVISEHACQPRLVDTLCVGSWHVSVKMPEALMPWTRTCGTRHDASGEGQHGQQHAPFAERPASVSTRPTFPAGACGWRAWRRAWSKIMVRNFREQGREDHTIARLKPRLTQSACAGDAQELPSVECGEPWCKASCPPSRSCGG